MFSTFIEYGSFFVLLAHHHIIAMTVFNTRNWFPATLYFDILFSGILCASFAVFALMIYRGWSLLPTSKIGRLTNYIPSLYFTICALGLDYLKQFHAPLLIVFLVASCFFIFSYAYNKFIAVAGLIKIIHHKSEYLFLVQLFFVSVTGGLVLATALSKISALAEIYGINVTVSLIIPLLILNLIDARVNHCLSTVKPVLNSVNLRALKANLSLFRKEIFAKIAINIFVGAFLVKWYFAIPLYLQYSEKWDADDIASLIFTASILSLIMNWLFLRVITHNRIHHLFGWFLVTFLVAIIFVSANLYFSHWVIFCVIFIAVFYNSLQSMINRIVHHEVITFEVNLVLLIVGSSISLILCGFISSGMSVSLVKLAGIQSQAFVTPLVLLFFAIIGLLGYIKLKTYRNLRRTI